MSSFEYLKKKKDFEHCALRARILSGSEAQI